MHEIPFLSHGAQYLDGVLIAEKFDDKGSW